MEGDIEDGEILDEESVDDQTPKNKKFNKTSEEQEASENTTIPPISKTKPFEQTTSYKFVDVTSVAESQMKNRRNENTKRKKSRFDLDIMDRSGGNNRKRPRPEMKRIDSVENEDDMICISGGSLQQQQQQLEVGKRLTLAPQSQPPPPRKEPLLPDPKIPADSFLESENDQSFRFGGFKYRDNDRRDNKGKYGSKGGGGGGNGNNQKEDSELCIFFLHGKCNRGSECGFIHALNKPRKLEPCKFYIMDRCNKRDRCMYMHNDFPCKFYHTGSKCFLGKDCKFSHRKLDEMHRKILWKYLNKYEPVQSETRKADRHELDTPPYSMNEDVDESMCNNDGYSLPHITWKDKDSKIPSLFDIKVPYPEKFSPTEEYEEDDFKESIKVAAGFTSNEEYNPVYNRTAVVATAASNNEEKTKPTYKYNNEYQNNNFVSFNNEEIDERPFPTSATHNDQYKYKCGRRFSTGYQNEMGFNKEYACKPLNGKSKEDTHKADVKCNERVKHLPSNKEGKHNNNNNNNAFYSEYQRSIMNINSGEETNNCFPYNEERIRKYDVQQIVLEREKNARHNESYQKSWHLTPEEVYSGDENIGESGTPVCSPHSLAGFSEDDHKNMFSDKEESKECKKSEHHKHKNNKDKDHEERIDEHDKCVKKKKSKKKNKHMRSNSEEKRYLEKEIRKLNRREQKHHRHKVSKRKNEVQNYDFPAPQMDESEAALYESNRNQPNIEEKDVTGADDKTVSEAPSHLPKKQQELYRRIQQHQREIDCSNETAVTSDSNENKDYNDDVNWYSSDEEQASSTSSSLATILESIKSNCSSSSTAKITTDVTTTTNIKPNKGDKYHHVHRSPLLNMSHLSNIHISDEVSKILSTIRMKTPVTESSVLDATSQVTSANIPNNCISSTQYVAPLSSSAAASDDKLLLSNRDLPMQTPDEKLVSDNKVSGGWWNEKFGTSDIVDTSVLNNTSDNEIVEPNIDVNDLPFKPIPAHDVANEIDASLTSHLPMEYKLIPLDAVPRVNYSSMSAMYKVNDLDPRFKVLQVKSTDSSVGFAGVGEPAELKPNVGPTSSSNKTNELRSNDPRIESTNIIKVNIPNLNSTISPQTTNRLAGELGFCNNSVEQVIPYSLPESSKSESEVRINEIRDPRLSRNNATVTDVRLGNFNNVNSAASLTGNLAQNTHPINLNSNNVHLNMPAMIHNTQPPPTCVNSQRTLNMPQVVPSMPAAVQNSQSNFNTGVPQNVSPSQNESRIPLLPRPTDPRIRLKNILSNK